MWLEERDKATKGLRGMPGQSMPMKDVVHCEKFWQGVCSRVSRKCLNGETHAEACQRVPA
jgi:hypothetical protein